jgi:hypothetical protein
MKNNIIRIILFLILLVTGFAGPLWVFAMSVVLYSFLYFGVEIIIIAAFIDAYFGYHSGGWFAYTLGVTAVLLIAQVLKPHLAVYNRY